VWEVCISSKEREQEERTERTAFGSAQGPTIFRIEPKGGDHRRVKKYCDREKNTED